MGAALDLFTHYVPGLKSGGGDNYTGFCPLHGEAVGKSKPSFSVNVATGMWCCFSGCGGGGIPRFLKEMGKPKSYIDSTMQRIGPYLQEARKKKIAAVGKVGLFGTSTPLPEKILGLYDQCPLQMLDEGFSEKVLMDHDVGYDEKYDRITFPIRDLYGTLAGISGKNLSKDIPGPKYKVYRKEIEELGFRDYEFDNHAYLWRGDRVYHRVVQERNPTVYVTEGYKTCLWLVQHGYDNVVCLMGSSMSTLQRILLERIGGHVVLALDNDPAGHGGTAKIGYALKGCHIHVLSYPDEVRQLDDVRDPDDLHNLVDNPVSFATWRRSHGQQLDVFPRFRSH